MGGQRADLLDLTDAERWELYAPWLEAEDAAVRANAVICLIHQANYLLDRQIAALERAFIEGGGYSEQLATERIRYRERDQRGESAGVPPACPKCQGLMTLRTAKGCRIPSGQFWGCTNYPSCKGTARV